MKATWMTWPALLLVCALPRPLPQAEVRRYVLAAGANFGGADRRCCGTRVGRRAFRGGAHRARGVDPLNAVVLKEPKVRDLVQAIDELSRRRPRQAAGRQRPHGGARLLLGPRRREGPAPRRRPVLVPEPARFDSTRCPPRAHCGPRCLRVGGVHAPQGREGGSRSSSTSRPACGDTPFSRRAPRPRRHRS